MSATHATVLYDAPGPIARRRYALFGVLGTLVLAGLVGYAIWRLAQAEQFTAEKWAPLLNPANEYFVDVWNLIGEGIRATAVAAALSIALSILIGTLLGIVRVMAAPAARLPLVGVLEVLRGLPVVIAIYFASRVLPSLGVDLSGLPGGDGLWFVVIGLTVYNSVVIAEILRAGINALPKGQREAAAAIGLSPWQSMRLIQLPQATRIMLPALISQIVVILKDTSLAAVLGIYPELLNAGKTIILSLKNPIQTYAVIGALFILVNLALSWLAHWLQKRSARAPRAAAAAPETVDAA